MSIKGQRQYEAFKAGKPLTYRQAILANCFVCNGELEGGVDCLTVSCPLYQFMPYRKGRIKKQLSPKRKAMAIENLRKARESAILSSETSMGCREKGPQTRPYGQGNGFTHTR